MGSARATARKHVLLAEDDLVTRTALAKALRALDLDVTEVPGGGKTLTAVTAQYRAGFSPSDIDLIVTDLAMPVVDGLDICKALRAAHCTTPLIIVTELDVVELEEVATRLGAFVLRKPVDITKLESIVTKLAVH